MIHEVDYLLDDATVPTLMIALESPVGRRTIKTAVADTGSSFTVAPLADREKLRVDDMAPKEADVKAKTADGEILTGDIYELTLRIVDNQNNVLEWTGDVLFTDVTHVLLGARGTFEHLRFTNDLHDRRMLFEPN